MMKLSEIVSRLRETQNKSEAPAEFEQAIADAFRFLGMEAQVIGGPGDTDVLLTANVGKESYKVSVDGKTSKTGKISGNQIDWFSLRDHRKKNQAQFVLVVGADFAGGSLTDRAKEHGGVSLLETDDLIRLMEAQAKFPLTLIELKDLFLVHGEVASQVEDLVSQSSARRNMLKQFRAVVEAMHDVQDGKVGYFTLQSVAAKEKIEDSDIELEAIESIISLLQLPFINGITSQSDNQYLMTIKTKDLANIFDQMSAVLVKEEDEEETLGTTVVSAGQPASLKAQKGTKYFRWEVSKNTVRAWARENSPYLHNCPLEHFKTIIRTVIAIFKDQNLVNKDLVYSRLQTTQLAPNRPFKGSPEEYKIYMALGILELEELLKWTGSKKPVEYTLHVAIDDLKKWCVEKLEQPGPFQSRI
ncbi:MAG: restriction endonuclease [Halobacteriota archaeon]|jgi:hypothetical protein